MGFRSVDRLFPSGRSMHSTSTSLLKAFLLILLPFHASAQSAEAYPRSLDEWHRGRIEELRSENGWLNLAGLFWLKPGKQIFGGSDHDDVAFPEGTIPSHAGAFLLSGDTVRMTVAQGVEVNMDGVPVHEAVAFHPGMSAAPTFRYGRLAWTVIHRGERMGIRLRDIDHPAARDFKGVERYPIDSTWRVKAKMVKPTFPTYIPITNVLGQTTPQPSPGKLVFELKGVRLTLDALEEGEELFLLFADETNGGETYPSGRFLYTGKPGPDGFVELDFNRSINPPCAFTAFATCPLPPRQNRLPMSIKAGEKDPGTAKKQH
jgi:hypothetical protein